MIQSGGQMGGKQGMKLPSPASDLAVPLIGTLEKLKVAEELTKILLSEDSDYEAHYANLRDVSPDAVSFALSTFFSPTLRTILEYLRNAGDSLSYPVTVARGSASQRHWARYALRRVNLTRLSADPHVSFERLREEFDAASQFHDLAEREKAEESGKSVHYNVFAADDGVKLYSGFVSVALQRVDERFNDRTKDRNLKQRFGLQDGGTIADISVYRPHPFEQNLGFYYDVGIDTSDVDRQILGKIAADLSGEVSGLTIIPSNPDYTTSHHSRYVGGNREVNPQFERVLEQAGFQRYSDRSVDFFILTPQETTTSMWWP